MENYSSFILKNRWLVIVASLAIVFIAAMGAEKLKFRSEYKAFFSEDNTQLNNYIGLQEIYSKSDNVAFILVPEDGNVFTEETLRATWELTNEAWFITHSSRVDSITNFQYSYADGDELIIEDLLLEADMLDEERIQLIKKVSLAEPLLKKKLIAETGVATIVNVTIRTPGVDRTEEIPEVALSARAVRDQFKEKYPNIKFLLSGITMMNNTFPETAKADATILIPIMVLVVILTIGLLLKTFVGTISTLIVIILSVAATMGIWGWTGGYLTGPSANSPTMILTLAVADCVHVLTTFYFNMRRGMDKDAALKDSLRVNMQPIFLTSLTTAIGFLTMLFSDAPPFGHMGVMVAIGVSFAFVFSVTIFPALLSVMPIKVKLKDADTKDLMDRFADFVIGNRKWLLPTSTLVIVLFSSFITNNELNDDFVKYFDTRVPFRQSTDYMQANLSGMSTIELSIDSKKESGISDPKFLKFVADMSDWIRSQPETDHVNTITDTLKRLNKNMHADDLSWYKLPDEKELAAQYLLLYELSLPQGLDVNNQLNVSKSSTRVIATFRNLTTNESIAMEKKINDYFAKHNESYGLTLASPTLMFAHIGKSNIVSMLLGSSLALVLISILLGFALKSVKFGFISLIPNLTPAAVGFGMWGMFVGEIGLGLSVVMGVTLGIIVDDTVHFLSKYVRARREKNLSSEDAVRYSFSSVGRALWITTMVLVAGFGVMATSTFKVNADMGLLTAITILIALIIDFLFLPPLLMKLTKDDRAKQLVEKT